MNAFIKGKQLRDAAWFDGPIIWYSNTLACGGVERQIIATARELRKIGIALDILCQSIAKEQGHNFFLPDANEIFTKIHLVCQQLSDETSFVTVVEALTAFLPGMEAGQKNAIAMQAINLLELRPRLLHIWNIDNLSIILAALVAGVPRIVVTGFSLAPNQYVSNGDESGGAAFAILANALQIPGIVLTNNSLAGCQSLESWLGLNPGSVFHTPNFLSAYASLLPEEAGFSMENKPQVERSILEEIHSNTPLVSIVLPTYNHLEFLPAAVDSVLAQDYPNFELIIVNDGSTDGTAQWLAGLEHPRVTILDGPNTRLPTALNRGFARARGEYFTWISADNICMPNFCSLLANALNNCPQAGFASAAFAFMDEAGLLWRRMPGKVTLDRILCHNVGIAAFMYPRKIAMQVGEYDPKIEGAEDWDMWLRILNVASAVYVPYLCYHYRCHKNSMSATMSGKIRIASTRVAYRALERLEKRGGVSALYPQIEHCRDRDLALFHANLILGSNMIKPGSFLKKSAIHYLERAYAMRPDDITALGNYGIALAWHDRWPEADALFRTGMNKAPAIFGELRTACRSQMRQNAGKHEFRCPVLSGPSVEDSELLQLLQAGEQ